MSADICEGLLRISADGDRCMLKHKLSRHASDFLRAKRGVCPYSTVTVLARFRGWSTFSARPRAM
jgi:hypothetical protein